MTIELEKHEKLKLDENLFFKADFKFGLIITCSDYQAQSKLPSLPMCEEDGDAVKSFLRRDCGFDSRDIKVSRDQSKEEIKHEVELIESTASGAGRLGKALVFVYYSGHGNLMHGDTFGRTVTGEWFNLDQISRSLAKHTNVYVISFFDCSREVDREHSIIPKGDGFIDVRGQFYTIYAAPPKKQAAADLKQTMSPTTQKFLKHMRSNPKAEFRRHMMTWSEKLNEVEITEKTQLFIQLLNQPHQN